MTKKKICSKCKENKETSFFYRDKSRLDGLRYQCKACDEKRAAIYRSKNIEKQREYLKRYRAENPEKVRKYEAGRDPEKARARDKRRRNALSDKYIKELIRVGFGIPSKQAPEWLIDAKRSHLKILREIREAKKK